MNGYQEVEKKGLITRNGYQEVERKGLIVTGKRFLQMVNCGVSMCRKMGYLIRERVYFDCLLTYYQERMGLIRYGTKGVNLNC